MKKIIAVVGLMLVGAMAIATFAADGPPPPHPDEIGGPQIPGDPQGPHNPGDPQGPQNPGDPQVPPPPKN